MNFLLDQGLPLSAARLLREAGHDAVHTAEIGLQKSTDAEILDRARQESRVVVTLDADFHTLLALANAADPSVVRIRIESLRAERCLGLILDVVASCQEDLLHGAAVSVETHGIRVRRLPFSA